MNNAAFQLLLRWSFVAIVILLAQPLAFEVSRAQEASQARSHLDSQCERTEKKSSSKTSHFEKLKDALIKKFEHEVRCLAMNIYFEARGEAESGQRAVGHVVMNRVNHPAYPNSACEVVHQGEEKQLHYCQFSWWCDGRSDKPTEKAAWDRSMRIARKIYLGILKDTTDGALWYHATSVTPYWSKYLLQGDKIGQHIFYLDTRQVKSTL